jgi:hypothetical protein
MLFFTAQKRFISCKAVRRCRFVFVNHFFKALLTSMKNIVLGYWCHSGQSVKVVFDMQETKTTLTP